LSTDTAQTTSALSVYDEDVNLAAGASDTSTFTRSGDYVGPGDGMDADLTIDGGSDDEDFTLTVYPYGSSPSRSTADGGCSVLIEGGTWDPVDKAAAEAAIVDCLLKYGDKVDLVITAGSHAVDLNVDLKLSLGQEFYREFECMDLAESKAAIEENKAKFKGINIKAMKAGGCAWLYLKLYFNCLRHNYEGEEGGC